MNISKEKDLMDVMNNHIKMNSFTNHNEQAPKGLDGGVQIKINNIGINELPARVGEMFTLLSGISQELTSIKQMIENENKSECHSLEEEARDIISRSADSFQQYEACKSNPDLRRTNNKFNKSCYDGIRNFKPKCRDRESFSHIGYNSLGDCKPEIHQTNPDISRISASQLAKNCLVEQSTDELKMNLTPSPFLIIANKCLKGPVLLNVGGKKHEVRWDTLDKFPSSRLGRLRHCVTHEGLQQLCDAYSLARREYYFDRSPRNFDAVLGLYRIGKLHLSQGVCVQDFCEELEYWGLTDLHLEPCCQHTYYRARWLLPQTDLAKNKEEDFGDGIFSATQKRLWNLFENPHHSKPAKVVAVVSCLFVVISTLCLIFSTLPKYQIKDSNGVVHEESFFEIAEAVFVGWFTFEYVIRFIAAPRKLKFLKGGMNIVDLLGILPYFMSLSLNLVTTTTTAIIRSKYQDEMRRIAQIFRIMRILRIFKLARHITGLQTLGMTLKNSYKELGLLMLVVIMGMLIFSGLAYVSEKDEEDTMFISMPQALYWAIITMTSVGYGDIYPNTWFGKLVGSACAICGVLCISLPIPIIVNNFNKFYEKAKIEEEILLKKKKASWEDAKRGVFQNINESFEQLNSTKYLYDIMHHQNGANFEELMNMRRISSVTGKVTQLNEQNNTKSQELTNSSSLEHNKSPPNFEFRNNKDHLMNSAGNNEHHVINSGPDHLIITGVGGGVGERHHHHAINKDLDMLAGAGGIQHRNSLNGINETPLVNNFTHCKKNNESCPSFDKLKD